MSDLPPVAIPPLSPRIAAAGTGSSQAENPDPSFGEILKTSLERINRFQQEADRAIQSLVLGRSQDLVGTLMTVEKAKLSLQVLVQVRNKLLEAYQEIMRMPL